MFQFTTFVKSSSAVLCQYFLTSDSIKSLKQHRHVGITVPDAVMHQRKALRVREFVI